MESLWNVTIYGSSKSASMQWRTAVFIAEVWNVLCMLVNVLVVDDWCPVDRWLAWYRAEVWWFVHWWFTTITQSYAKERHVVCCRWWLQIDHLLHDVITTAAVATRAPCTVVSSSTGWRIMIAHVILHHHCSKTFPWSIVVSHVQNRLYVRGRVHEFCNVDEESEQLYCGSFCCQSWLQSFSLPYSSLCSAAVCHGFVHVVVCYVYANTLVVLLMYCTFVCVLCLHFIATFWCNKWIIIVCLRTMNISDVTVTCWYIGQRYWTSVV